MEIALEAGAEDVRDEGDTWEVICAPADFEAGRGAIEAAGIAIAEAEITMLPASYIALEGKEAEQMVRLMDMLEDNDDVQKVYTNADIPEEMVG
jgi:transcriptional/translational regulatory protein YebC/TACO1